MTQNYLDSLSKRLETWLAPEDIIAAAHSLANAPAEANKPASLILKSLILKPEADGGLFHLCNEFLQRFRVPVTLIDLLRNLEPSSSLDAAWVIIQNAKFEGTIEQCDPGQLSLPYSVLQITDINFLTDILIQPLKGLQGIVATMAANWDKLKEMGVPKDTVYHKHRSPEPLAVWLDAYVAARCGFPEIGRGDRFKKFDGPHIRYRAVTIHNYRESNSRLLAAIKDMSIAQANSTLTPIWMTRK